MWRVALRGLVARRRRLALSAAAVAVSVGFVAGTLLLTDSASRAAEAAGQAAIADDVKGIRTALLVFGIVALLVAVILIRNTFAILVAQRSRELGLLRAIGASRRQMLGSVVGEAALLGAVASVVGIAVGVGVGPLLKAVAEQFGTDLPEGGLVLLPRTILVAATAGVGTTIVASLLPALRAARVPPVAAMRAAGPASRRTSRRRLRMGASLIAIGSVAAGSGAAGLGRGPLVGGSAATLVGFVLVLPGSTRVFAQIAGWIVSRFGGAAALLAARNLERDPRRTAATAGALMVGIALVSFGAVVASSVRGSATAVLERTIRADVVVTPVGGRLSPDVIAAARARPEVARSFVARSGSWQRSSSESRGILTVDAAALGGALQLDVRNGDASSIAEAAVLVSDELARKDGHEVGDTISMRLPQQTVSARVGGIFRASYANLLSTGYVLASMYSDLLGPNAQDVMFVIGRPGTRPATVLAQELRGHGTQVWSRDRYIAALASVTANSVNQIIGLLSALVGFSIVVALFGIANTLALSIVERWREIGLLRAVGMDRRRVRSMVLWEGSLIATQGAAAGIGLGLFAAWVMAHADTPVMQTLIIPIPRLVLFATVAAATGILAALRPASHVSRLAVVDGLREV